MKFMYPASRLAGTDFPALVRAIETYERYAGPLFDEEQVHLFHELAYRVKQCIYATRRAREIIEEHESSADRYSFYVMQKFLDGIGFYAETFYWMAFRVRYRFVPQYPKKGLPHVAEKSVPARAVRDIRNYAVEHPERAGRSVAYFTIAGPLIHGGHEFFDANGRAIQDEGLFANAAEWAKEITAALNDATAEIAKSRVPNPEWNLLSPSIFKDIQF